MLLPIPRRHTTLSTLIFCLIRSQKANSYPFIPYPYPYPFPYTHHMVTALETELTDWLDLDVSFVWDRIQDPQANADGTVPKQNDYYFILGLGIEF